MENLLNIVKGALAIGTLALVCAGTYGTLQKGAKLELERVNARSEAFYLADQNKNGIMDDGELMYLGRKLKFFERTNPITLRELEKKIMGASKDHFVWFIEKEYQEVK